MSKKILTIKDKLSVERIDAWVSSSTWKDGKKVPTTPKLHKGSIYLYVPNDGFVSLSAKRVRKLAKALLAEAEKIEKQTAALLVTKED